MDSMEVLNKQLSDTFNTMKQEGLVDDNFTFLYSLKLNVEDRFYAELIPDFCLDVRGVLKLLAEMVVDGVMNHKLMREHVYKAKGGSLSIGACRMALAFTNLESAIDDKASKEECLKAVKQAEREYCALEQKLHICLQAES
ncbi:HPT domain superfamily [Sesbania bispinosa]|nr:HPT domain superfamily [Sesbania bispinosa]